MVATAQLPVKVKNTFIDIDDKFIEYDNEDEWFVKDTAMRQMSAPAPSIVRQTSERSPLKGIRKMMEAGTEIYEEQEDEESSEPLEPELEPKRQSSASAEEDLEPKPWQRMVTGGSLCGFDAPLSAATGVASMDEMGADALAQPLWPMYMMYQPPGPGVPYDMDYASAESAAVAAPMTPAVPLEGTGGAMIPPAEWANTTTVMMRNLPNKYTQMMLFAEMNQTGFEGSFDFLYLPIDPETSANRGYAFVNFIDSGSAWMFKLAFDGKRMSRFNSEKRISVMPAALQGFEANHAHYSQARVNQGDKNVRPLFLRDAKPSGPSSGTEAAGPSRGRRRRGGRGSLIDRAAAAQQQDNKQQHQHLLGQQQQLQQLLLQQQLMQLQPGVQNSAGLASCAMAAPFVPAATSDSLAGVGPVAKTGEGEPAGRDGIKFCPWCGSKVEEAFRFCQYCGKSLDMIR